MQMINLAWLRPPASACLPRQIDRDKPRAQWPNSLSSEASSLLPKPPYLEIATPLHTFRSAITRVQIDIRGSSKQHSRTWPPNQRSLRLRPTTRLKPPSSCPKRHPLSSHHNAHSPFPGHFHCSQPPSRKRNGRSTTTSSSRACNLATMKAHTSAWRRSQTASARRMSA